MKNLWSKRWFKITIFAIIGFGVVGAFVEEPQPAGEVPQEVPQEVEEVKMSDKIDAWVCAQNEIERNLKSPSTAKFPWSGYKAVDLGDNKWIISSYVDAQNGFGAMIRTNFMCNVEVTDVEKILCNTSCSTN